MYVSGVICPLLRNPSNGNVMYPNGTSRYHGHKILYSCNSGYRISGDPTRTCTQSGEQGIWSGRRPSCLGNFSFTSIDRGVIYRLLCCESSNE